MNTPLIKWTGSKRHISKEIVNTFPKNINTYYEPFLGGGSVLFELLKNNDINVGKIYVSDVNKSLIDIFKIVKDEPQKLIDSYHNNWNEVQKDPNFYYLSRTEYNINKDPHLFYFLTRTCYNGTIRYNKNGEFNTSHHFGRKGMDPITVKNVIYYYHNLLQKRNIVFECKSFIDIKPQNQNDVIFLDPPYTNTKSLYFGNINLDSLLKWVDELPYQWFMTINGINSKDNEEKIDIHYTGKKILNSGNSSFSRMKGKNINVGEYFYYRMT